MPDEWYQISYRFVDENGDEVSMTIADVFTPGIIESHYDEESNCATAEPSATSLVGNTPLKTAMAIVPVAHTKATVLKGKEVNIPLQVMSNKKFLSPAPQTKGVEPGHALLIIENLDIKGDPEVTYNIYISSTRDAKRSAYIATLNYFGLLEPVHKEHRDSSNSTKIGTLTYDVQEELMELGVTSTADVAVRFVPSNFMTEKVKKRTTKGSVTVGNIRLEQVGGGEVK
jgi:hypothetical protein